MIRFTGLEEAIINLYEQFQSLPSYEQKLSFFDQHFGLIPFSFAPFDVMLSWYYFEPKTLALTGILNKDSLKTYKIYQKTFSFPDHTFTFDITPAGPVQRFSLNHYILSVFLNEKDVLLQHLSQEVQKAGEPYAYVQEKLKDANAQMQWIKDRLMDPPAHTFLKDRYLAVFYKGYLAHITGFKEILQVRRKYGEWYLYSQGYLYACYLKALKEISEQVQQKFCY